MDDHGRQLCHPCRNIVIGATSETMSPSMMARAFSRIHWESEAMGRCWHCTGAGVDPDDDLGLCPGCKEELVST